MTTTTGQGHQPHDPVAVRRSALRAAGRRARAGLDPATRTSATAAVVERLAELPALRAAARVMLTRAIGDELDLAALERRLRAAGVTVALPVVDGADLAVVDVTDDTAFVPGWHGVPEPVGPPAAGPVDLVVVPALTLDRRGGRLGYGGGHYDRFLARAGAGATTVGAVYDAQLVDEVPTLPHDVRLDLVVTEAGTWDAGAATH